MANDPRRDGPKASQNLLLAGGALLIYVASTLVRFWYVLVAHHPRHHITSDVVALVDLAERLIVAPQGQALADTIWPPGTAAILGALMTFDASLGLAAVVQAVLGALVPLLIAHTAYLALGRRPGLVALVFASLHFGFIHYGGFFLSEQLFQFSVTLALWASLAALGLAEGLDAARPDRARRARALVVLLGAGCGAAWAFASAFRPNALPVALAVGSALFLRAARARTGRMAAMLVVGLVTFVLALAPLSVRCSALKGGGFCPVSSNVAMNMALGQSGELSGLSFVSASDETTSTTWVPPSLLQHGYGGIGTVPASIYDTGGVLAWVGGRLVAEPGRFLLRATGNMLDLFRLEYWPDDDGVDAERVVTVAKQAFFLFVIAPALVALVAAARVARRRRTLPVVWFFVIAVVAAVLATAALSMGEARYRLPFDGVLILCAASLVTDVGGGGWTAPIPATRVSPWLFAVVAMTTVGGAATVAVASSPRWHALGALARLVERAPAAAGAVIRRPAAELSSPRMPGSAWDAPGNQILRCAPECGELRVTFPERERAAALELSLDNNDRYELIFYRGEEAVAALNVDARPSSRGLRVEELAVPSIAAELGFDAVGVRPLYGDGIYALGHLRLVD